MQPLNSGGCYNRCIRVLTTELEQISVVSTQTHGRGDRIRVVLSQTLTPRLEPNDRSRFVIPK